MGRLFRSKCRLMGLARSVIRTQPIRDVRVVLIQSPWLGNYLGDLSLMKDNIKIDLTEIGEKS